MKSVLIQFVWETFRWILTLKKKSDWAKYCWYLFRAVGESFTFSNWIFLCCHFLREISNDWILCMALLHAHPFGDKYWEEIYGKCDSLRRKIIWLDILASRLMVPKVGKTQGNFQHILYICLSKQTLLSSQKNISNLSSVTRKWTLKFCWVRGKIFFFIYSFPAVCKYITWN